MHACLVESVFLPGKRPCDGQQGRDPHGPYDDFPLTFLQQCFRKTNERCCSVRFQDPNCYNEREEDRAVAVRRSRLRHFCRWLQTIEQGPMICSTLSDVTLLLGFKEKFSTRGTCIDGCCRNCLPRRHELSSVGGRLSSWHTGVWRQTRWIVCRAASASRKRWRRECAMLHISSASRVAR